MGDACRRGTTDMGTRTAPDLTGRNPLTGILLKVASVAVFVAMASFIKAAGQVPAGQIVFFRSFFAVFPILLVLAFRHELRGAFSTTRPGSHVVRGLVGVSAMGARLLRADPAAAAGGGDTQLCPAAAGRRLLGDLHGRDDPHLPLERGGGRADRCDHHFMAQPDAVHEGDRG
jgi:hypothetical protein